MSEMIVGSFVTSRAPDEELNQQVRELKREVTEVWRAMVMLKRELDPHESKPGFLQLPASAWDEAVRRLKPFDPVDERG